MSKSEFKESLERGLGIKLGMKAESLTHDQDRWFSSCASQSVGSCGGASGASNGAEKGSLCFPPPVTAIRAEFQGSVYNSSSSASQRESKMNEWMDTWTDRLSKGQIK